MINFDRLRNRRFLRKSQVTIFIIIGLVILISLIIFLLVKSKIEKEEIAPGKSMIVEELPTEFLPVRPFVDSCLEQTAIQGLTILGERGGYAYTDHLDPKPNPTDGNAVRFSQGSDLVVPYWFYLKSDNTCLGTCNFASEKLPLKGSRNSIEAELSTYIEDNIERCFNGFEGIKEMGFDVEAKAKPKIETYINDDNVVVALEYPMTISKNNRIEVQNFHVNLDLNLKRIYDMSDYLSNLEQDYRYLERAALNLIVAFTGIDKNKLPPMSDSEVKLSSTVSWKKSEVKENVKDILSSYIQLLRVANTMNWQEIEGNNIYQSKLYNRGLSIPNNISINDLEVNFYYLDFWDIYFDLNCDGEICQPESGFFDWLPIGLQRYNFAYDVSFPIMVEITDPQAFHDEGYTFSFMLEGNFRNNQPLQAHHTELVSSGVEASMLCDENKRTSGDITIQVLNANNNEKLDDVEVIYECIDSCYIGTTTNGQLVSQLPICLGGLLTFKKEGFLDNYVEFDTELEQKGRVLVHLEPKKEMNVELMKQTLLQSNGAWIPGPVEPLDEKETAIITFKGSDYQIVEVTHNSSDTVQLSEGLYEIDISLIRDEDLTINAPEGPPLNTSSFITGATNLQYDFSDSDLEKDTLLLTVLSADIYRIPPEQRDISDIVTDYSDLEKEHFLLTRPELK